MFTAVPITLLQPGNKPNALGAIPAIPSLLWQLIDWQKVTRIVKSLQARIVQAAKNNEWKKVRDLQRVLTRSTSANLLSIRRVTENSGKRTAGIDGQHSIITSSMPRTSSSFTTFWGKSVTAAALDKKRLEGLSRML